ncbi:MAG: hypothetical protein M0R73_13935 [Dehalococcoidia bacterium]|nr:hypothetical protein [Dehalococcoidia bacterium]
MNLHTTPLNPVPEGDYARSTDPTAAPEWLLLVARSVEDGQYLLLRRAGHRALSLLSTRPPHRTEGFAVGITSLLRTHLAVTMRDQPRVSPERRPVHALHPYTGGQGTGYLRAVAVEVAGEPRTDALYQGVVALPLTDAADAVSTDLERLILLDGAKLLGDRIE